MNDMLISASSIGRLQVSSYENVWGEKYKDMALGRVLNGIRICAYGQEVNAARACLFNR